MKRRKSKISRQDLRFLIAFAFVATVISSTVAYAVLNPSPEEQFFAMWILGSAGTAEHYYPNDNPNLRIGDEVMWTLGVYNHMNSLQYVVLRVKLLNSTLSSPNDTLGSPSPVPPLFEFRRVLLSNETWSIPFVWKILNHTTDGGDLVITDLLLNHTHLSGQLARAVSGYNFRFVFELWYYDLNARDLAFSWQAQSAQHSVWTQIWFNVTMTR